VPAGRPIKVTFTSEDVLHSMFFPAFRTKADAIPGRYSTVWFTPTIVGEHHLFCAEYCGTNHSGMVGKVIVMEPTAYEAWLTGNVVGRSLVSRGEQLFSDLACNTCHLSDGRGRGPSLTNKFGAAERLATGATVAVDEGYVRESILMPQAKLVDGYQPLMPTFQGLVSEENVMALVEYVKSLRVQTGAVSRGQAPEEPASRPAPQENR
jgi:cytochrome c oxidase subunit 2